jgi:Aerotolerance regulator N-terminal
VISGFLNPALAIGALLAVVPLIIHLLNRRRHRPLSWGAMRFVALAHKRTRRRAFFEDLLLLLLRMGAVVALAFALARPLAQGTGLLAPLTESRRNLALIVDASASTGYRQGLESTFDRILTRARERVSSLDASRGDRVLLVWGDDQPRLLAWRGPEEALAFLNAGQLPSDGALDLGQGLAVIEEALASELFLEDGAALELVLLCDGQRSLFEPRLELASEAPGLESDAAPGMEAAQPAVDDSAESSGGTGASGLGSIAQPSYFGNLDRLRAQGLSLRVEDLSSAAQPENVSLTELSLVQPPRGPGLPVELLARVVNHSDQVRPGTRLALYVDGARAPVRSLDLPASGAAESAFSLSFDAPGTHLIEAALETDGLPIDDRRALVIDVPRPLRILGINGAPDGRRIEEDELGFFGAVLTPPEEGRYALGGLSPFEWTSIEADRLALGEADFAEYDLFVMANVANPSSESVARLNAAVLVGAGLIISFGDRTQPLDYAQRLFAIDGTGLLPAEPLARVAVPSRRDGYFRVTTFDAVHPVLSFFADERWRPYLTEVPFFEFIEVRPLPDARILAQLDERLAPLLIERRIGQGRVLLFTSTLDAAWTRLPESPRSFVPFVHELCFYAGRRPGAVRNVALGRPLRAELLGFPRAPQLERPDGSRSPLTSEPKALDERRWSLELSPAARRVGVWKLLLEGQSDELFSVGFDAREGQLDRLAGNLLSSLHPALDARAESEDSTGPTLENAGGEWWRPLALLCLLMLVGEALLSGWLSYRRGGLPGSKP